MLCYERASRRNVLSLQNWVNENACLARDETAFLTHGEDLITLAPLPHDGATEWLETWIEVHLIKIGEIFFGKVWGILVSFAYVHKEVVPRSGELGLVT